MCFFNPYTIAKTLLAPIFVLLISPALLAGETESSSLGNVVIPQPATPENVQQCVEPTEIMRREHMNFLLHQREQTVLDGIRTKKYSFTGCIDCHAQPSNDGKIVRFDDPEYFCTTCHQYTAVNIDCFECHSDQPSAAAKQISQNFSTEEILARIDSSSASNSLRSSAHKPLLQQVEISGD